MRVNAKSVHNKLDRGIVRARELGNAAAGDAAYAAAEANHVALRKRDSSACL
jgi:hypothetical protein